MPLPKVIDTGTPLRESAETVALSIDGRAIRVAKGTSIMAAARSHGIEIPKLCATDSVEAFGSCRLCLVEIEGRRGTPASCTTPAEDGLVVHTQTARLAALRRGVMELYVSDTRSIASPAAPMATASCRTWLAWSACATCATATRAPSTAAKRKTRAIPTSPSTRASASSARAACAPAPRCKALSR